MMKLTNKAQSMLEYTLLLGIVVAVLVSMSIYVRRSSQAMTKLIADQIGNQINAEQANDAQFGYIVQAQSDQTLSHNDSVTYDLGDTTYGYGPSTTATDSQQLINQGFSSHFEYDL